MIQFFCIHDQIKFLILVVKKCHGETSPNKLNNFECKNFFSCVTQWSSVDFFKALTIIWNLKLAKKETHILHRKCLGSLFHKTHYEIFHKRQLSFYSLKSRKSFLQSTAGNSGGRSWGLTRATYFEGKRSNARRYSRSKAVKSMLSWLMATKVRNMISR